MNSDLSLVQDDFEEWFDVDDTQKMSRVESAYDHVEEIIPLEEALVLQDQRSFSVDVGGNSQSGSS